MQESTNRKSKQDKIQQEIEREVEEKKPVLQMEEAKLLGVLKSPRSSNVPPLHLCPIEEVDKAE